MAADRFPKTDVVITQLRSEIFFLTKFGTLRDPDLLRTCVLPNWNRKLIRDLNGCHLENINDLIITALMVRFT